MVPLLQRSAYVYDVVIVGGGPAGLSAALVLGREELRPYGTEQRAVEVTGIVPSTEGFEITLADGERLSTRTVLIASGVHDDLPDIPGVGECYGVSVHHCPYCDGWEARDKALVVIGHGAAATALALSLKTWSDRVTMCSNGRARLRPGHRERLAAHAIQVHEARISTLEHENGYLRQVVMKNGERIACDAIFFATAQRPQCDLPRQLGRALTRHGLVNTDHLGHTRVAGLQGLALERPRSPTP